MYIVHSPAHTHTHTHTKERERKVATMLKSKRDLGSPFSAVPVNSYGQIEEAYNLKRVFLTLRIEL